MRGKPKLSLKTYKYNWGDTIRLQTNYLINESHQVKKSIHIRPKKGHWDPKKDFSQDKIPILGFAEMIKWNASSTLIKKKNFKRKEISL